ncbi:MAG: hypothetical protein NTW28_08865, partial [Candidatus Solibacter sp.]|nr:hypothetical protein [Candidatus Solibacter sp.]
MTWLDFVVRGTLVLAAGFAASLAFGRASAAVRHLIWTAAFVALLALPFALGLAPRIRIAAWPGAQAAGEGASAVRTAATALEPRGTRQTLPTQRVPRRGSDWG